MSTQDADAGIPISILPESDLQHVRLLELPAELLALVTGEKPPMLQLKSSEDIQGNTKDANAVLCTPDKTYNIRQVSTSNSVYLTKPCETPDQGGGPPRMGVEAIAKCDSTLELLPAEKQSAIPYIRNMLPVFTSNETFSSRETVRKEELFAHIPLSDAECEEGYSDLACFFSQDLAGCAIPSAQVKMQIWKTALTAAVAGGYDVTQVFSTYPRYAEDDLQQVCNEEDLLAGVFRGMSLPQGEGFSIHPDKCVRFVGYNLLEAQSGRTTSTSSFLTMWKDAVPEAWRDKCQLSALQNAHELQDGGKNIVFAEGGIGTRGTSKQAAETKSSIGAKRSWHEKFRPSKKQA